MASNKPRQAKPEELLLRVLRVAEILARVLPSEGVIEDAPAPAQTDSTARNTDAAAEAVGKEQSDVTR